VAEISKPKAAPPAEQQIKCMIKRAISFGAR
jgi:hypothetical protein